MSLHLVGVCGLILVFVIGALRPVNLGSLALLRVHENQHPRQALVGAEWHARCSWMAGGLLRVCSADPPNLGGAASRGGTG